MNNVGVIDTFLNTFTTYIDSGFGLIKGEVGYLSSTLIVVDITLAGLFWAWGADEDIHQRLVKKTLYIGFFAFIINNFNNLSAIVFNSFAGLGLKAGGSSISTADFLRPGKLAQVGLDAGQPPGEMPPLFVIGPAGGSELVNYRVNRNYYIVDRLFAAAELYLGDKDSERRVRIVRTDGRPRS